MFYLFQQKGGQTEDWEWRVNTKKYKLNYLGEVFFYIQSYIYPKILSVST